MKTVTDVNTVNQLLTYSKQAEAGIHQKAIQMLLGAGNNKKQDSLSISDAARGFSKQSIAALIDKNANISNNELAYYFANYNNSSAILDAINFGENVSCGYNSDFKEYGVIYFELNGSRQVVPNYAVSKMNTSTLSGICAANNSLVLSNKSYYSWTTSKLTIAKMAGVEENDIDRLLVNPPEKVKIEVKYKIDVTVMEGVSQTILKKVILVLLKISRMIKSKCKFRFSGCS